MTNSDITLETVPCPLCGSSEFGHVMTCRDWLCGIAGEYQFVKCRSCGHVYLNPCPTDASLPACYPEDYGPHQETAPATVPDPHYKPWYARPPIRWIPGIRPLYYWLSRDDSQIIPEPESDRNRALEIGTGRGDFLTKLRDAGWSVHGIEPSPAAAELARSLGHTVETGTIESSTHPNDSFDAIFAWMVLEHVKSPSQFFDRTFQWLNSGGRIYFSVPNYESLERCCFGMYWPAWDAPRHLHQFRPRILKQLLSDAGFTEINITNHRSVRDYFGGAGLWLLDRNPNSRFGKTLLNWFLSAPPMFVHLACAPIAIVLSGLKTTGQLTVSARKPRGET
ncbi:class I SAM-dependent methyltransferase [Thalassoglobus neptunius]|uniref:class I SAM-dependent methyltransferase n=1 Tax=Thalassoglobus neptunius TaxID=1938619 RepID=UPI0018D238D9|nr:class I SAM-dependent methyltransferase [Thalassoglobus neptunius]